MPLALRPLVTTAIRSSSLGGASSGVDLYLNSPWVKSRGRGIIDGAEAPLPRPSRPWQKAQFSK